MHYDMYIYMCIYDSVQLMSITIVIEQDFIQNAITCEG